MGGESVITFKKEKNLCKDKESKQCNLIARLQNKINYKLLSCKIYSLISLLVKVYLSMEIVQSGKINIIISSRNQHNWILKLVDCSGFVLCLRN